MILKGLNRYSWQGDSEVARLFEGLGVKSKHSSRGLELLNIGEIMSSFKYDFTDQPDLAQTFAVTCAFLGVPFKLSGLHTLKIKETDRINALVNELGKFGFLIETNNVDCIEWSGKKGEALDKISVATYKDHRMAMAFALLLLRWTNPLLLKIPQLFPSPIPFLG